MFNHLKVPESWNSYFSKYPNGLTIMEALVDWVGQVDLMSDHINDYTLKIDDFLLKFDENLQNEVYTLISDWASSGYLQQLLLDIYGSEIKRLDIQLSTKRDKSVLLTQSDLSTTSEAHKLTPNHLNQEVKDMMTGSTPVSPNIADGQITIEKIAFKEVSSLNIVDETKFENGKYVSNINGTLLENAVYRATDYIPVKSSTKYTKNGLQHQWTAFYTSSKVFISALTNASNVFTTPANASYVRTTFKNTDADVQLNEGDLKPYDKYQFAIKNEYISLNNAIENNHIKLEAVSTDKTDFIEYGENLYVEEYESVSKFLNPTGLLQDNVSYDTSDYIKVLPATKYTLSSNRSYVLFDEQKRVVYSKFDAAGVAETITTTADTAFIRFSVPKDGTKSIALGETVSTQKGYVQLKGGKPIPGQGEDELVINLPEKITILQNKPFTMQFQSFINVNLNDYDLDVVCTKGAHMGDKYTLTPSVVENIAFKLDVYQKGVFIASKSTTLEVISEISGSGTKRILALGDSTINAGTTTQHLLDLAASDINQKVQLIGTRTTGDASNKHEGRGGWTADLYRKNTMTGGLTNPFYDGTDFNFTHYMTTNGFTGVDQVHITLGINDTFSYGTDDSLNAAIVKINANLEHIITSIKTYNANTKVFVNITIPPHRSQNAFGTVYGCGQTRWRYKRNNAIWQQNIIKTFGGRESNGIYIIPVHTCIDEAIDINDGVHPTTAGYNKIGDVAWSYIKGV